VNYTLDNVILADGEPITGTFDWTFSIGDFEGGRGVFTALEIPWRPNNSVPPLEQAGMVLTIEEKQIEISLDGNFHDYGLDISLKFLHPLSPTQSTLIDLAVSFFECCGNGFKDQAFSSGSISPIAVPICEGDFDGDGDVDRSNLAVFAEDFGRTDCDTGLPCEGDFDDNNVDGSDLAAFAADFGRTDCPIE